jgi:hypothetical protein
MLPPLADMEAFIRSEAARLGIDPEVAVAVARSEGLSPGTWQSNIQQPYGREASYGPFQLHVDPTGKRPGLGNEFKARTGLDPANPDTWDEGVTFALEQARKGGWGPWMGAAKIGVKGMHGIGGNAPAMPTRGGPGIQPPAGLLADPVREDRGGPYNSGYGAAAPGNTPAPAAETNWAELGEIGGQLLEKAKADQEPEQFKWLQPQVFQPLRRIQLGKGLLG